MSFAEAVLGDPNPPPETRAHLDELEADAARRRAMHFASMVWIGDRRRRPEVSSSRSLAVFGARWRVWD